MQSAHKRQPSMSAFHRPSFSDPLRLGRVNGADTGASAAIDAGGGIDHLLAVVADADGADRTFALTGAAADAGVFVDCVCHNVKPPFF